MRLWPLCIIDQLPRQQLLGQHRECCALRGKGWGRKHSTVDYVFKHRYEDLFEYHMFIMAECIVRRNYNINPLWLQLTYRGKNCERAEIPDEMHYKMRHTGDRVYPEHDEKYLDECVDNLARKGVAIDKDKALKRLFAA